MMVYEVREIYKHLLHKPYRNLSAEVYKYKRKSNWIWVILKSSYGFDMNPPLYHGFVLGPRDKYCQGYVFQAAWEAERWLHQATTNRLHNWITSECVYWYSKFYHWINNE
jgi:hypothetical protein